MKISINGINLIKSFESCKLVAYKALSSEKYYTIGWGHYGSDVKKGMVISQAQADALLVQDLAKFEANVNKYATKLKLNQNQYDALVSFAYNVGSINGLTAFGTRSVSQISAKIPNYNKSGGKVIAGLVTRRAKEKRLFDTPVQASYIYNGVDYSPVFDPTYYSSKYSDLRTVYGTNSLLLFEHFKAYGMKEGRQAHSGFNVAVYKSSYADLRTAFGDDLPSYYRHYCTNGRFENRVYK